ncbi:class I SAM-dependent methyltransferase [Thermocaproicibacter melissae]
MGCGNGKMLKYLQERTGANIHGFDYSEQAIEYAKMNAIMLTLGLV